MLALQLAMQDGFWSRLVSEYKSTYLGNFMFLFYTSESSSVDKHHFRCST